MKKIITGFLFTFLFFTTVFAADKEVVVIKVEYSKKKDGYHSNMRLDIGSSTAHSLYHSITNEETGAVSYKNEDGKITAFTNEVDLMNFLFTLGYSYQEVYISPIMTETIYNFVLVKE